MSLAKLNHVKAARKPATCEKCGKPIEKGTPYLWYQVGFRSKYVHKRHEGCAPRPSERESSNLSEVYSAQEEAADAVNALRGEAADALDENATEIVETLADAIREVAQTYREADDQFGGGGMTDSGERADTLEEAADQLEGFSLSASIEDAEPCEKHAESGELAEGCEDCDMAKSDAWDAVLDEVQSALDEVSV